MNLSLSPAAGRWRLAGNRRLLLLCLLLFLLSGSLSFWMFLPVEILQQRLVQSAERQTGLQMNSDRASLLFPLGIELDLEILPRIPELAPVKLQELQLAPAWTSLVTKSPAVALNGGLAGGRFAGQAAKDGRVALEFSDLTVEQLVSESSPYRPTGKLQGQFDGENLASRDAGKGDFRLRWSNAGVLGLEKFGLGENFSLGVLEVEGKFERNRLSLEKVVMIDGLVEMSGGGTLQIGDTPQRTRLNLNIKLLTTPATPPALRDLLQLTGVQPAADGSYLLRISGTLARPRLR